MEETANVPMPFVELPANVLPEICTFLLEDSNTWFDSLACITAIDNGTEAGTLALFYNLYSIPHEHAFCVKITLPRDAPHLPTVSNIWPTANWHEREAYDLMGVVFDGHPDLRRILLPDDWEGHPLRKDYLPQETYHGIQVKY